MSDRLNIRYAKERCFALIVRLSLLICAGILTFLLGSIFIKGIGAISLEFLFTPAKEFGRSGGIFYQLLGSLLIALVATVLVVPVAIGTSLFQYSFNAKKGIGYLLEQSLYALNAIPSITYGIFGLIFFVCSSRQHFQASQCPEAWLSPSQLFLRISWNSPNNQPIRKLCRTLGARV